MIYVKTILCGIAAGLGFAAIMFGFAFAIGLS